MVLQTIFFRRNLSCLLVYLFTFILVYSFTCILVYSFTKFLFNNYFLNLCLFVHEERGTFVELLRAFRREAMQAAAC